MDGDDRTVLPGDPLFQLVVDASPAGMVITSADGLIVLVNRQALEWFGYKSSELIGQPVEILVPPAQQNVHSGHRARYMQHAKPRPMARGQDLFGCRKDGSEFPIDISLHPFRSGGERLVLANILDATARLQAKRVPKERLAAIGEMVAGLAHESRNALQRARGCLDLLELDLEGNDEQLDLTRRIRCSLEDLERHYEEVRNYAAPITLRKTQYDVANLVDETFTDLRFEASDIHHEIAIQAEGRTENLVDRHRLKQVFRNILENAIAASPDNSCIDVIIGSVVRDGEDCQLVEFHDRGTGISEEQVARIFDPFFTTKQSGTGLGLAISKRIVDAHNGRIEAENRAGVGFVVRIELPRQTSPAES